MIKAVIFDMDGVIFDTEKLLLNCWKNAGKKYNINIKDEDIAKFRGTTVYTGEKIFKEIYPDIDFWQIRQEREKLKEQHILENGLPIKEGVEDLLKYIKEKGLKIGLASSTKQEVVMKYLEQSKFLNYFDYIICGDMVENGKPEPDIYIEVCKHFNIFPKEAIVLEDSKNGILSAHKAGCNILMVVDIDEHYEETKDMIIGKIFNYKEVEKYITEGEKNEY